MMDMKKYRIFWHPHQGLWNWNLVMRVTKDMPTRRPASPVTWLIIYLDSLILWGRALFRRIRKTGLPSLFKSPRALDGREIIYLDIGTHRGAKELDLVANSVLPKITSQFRAFGFEANEDSFNFAKEKFQGSSHIVMVHGAVCHNIPENGVVRLYKHGGGYGDSLYLRGEIFSEVKALRLSDWIREQQIDLSRSIVILRMNIEGAETDVIRDLSDSGMLNRIDGFYGMWDDLSKISFSEDKIFRDFLRAHGVEQFTFNERDFLSAFRIGAIIYDIHTSILHAQKKKL